MRHVLLGIDDGGDAPGDDVDDGDVRRPAEQARVVEPFDRIAQPGEVLQPRAEELGERVLAGLRLGQVPLRRGELGSRVVQRRLDIVGHHAESPVRQPGGGLCGLPGLEGLARLGGRLGHRGPHLMRVGRGRGQQVSQVIGDRRALADLRPDVARATRVARAACVARARLARRDRREDVV